MLHYMKHPQEYHVEKQEEHVEKQEEQAESIGDKKVTDSKAHKPQSSKWYHTGIS